MKKTEWIRSLKEEKKNHLKNLCCFVFFLKKKIIIMIIIIIDIIIFFLTISITTIFLLSLTIFLFPIRYYGVHNKNEGKKNCAYIYI